MAEGEVRPNRPLTPDPRRVRAEAILFDYGGTLDAAGIPWKERFYAIYRRCGVDVTPGDFDRAFYASDDALMSERIFDWSLLRTVREQVRRVLRNLGVEDRELNRQIADRFYEDSRRHIEGNLEILRQLGETHLLGIVSNNYGNLDRICRETGLGPLVDVAVDSNRVGAAKPDRRIFDVALAALGLRPEQAVMVGDSVPRDMEGAKAVGMPHVLLVPPGRLAEARSCCEGDRVIASLAELLEDPWRET